MSAKKLAPERLDAGHALVGALRIVVEQHELLRAGRARDLDAGDVREGLSARTVPLRISQKSA